MLACSVESKISAGLLKIVFSLCIVISLTKTMRRNDSTCTKEIHMNITMINRSYHSNNLQRTAVRRDAKLWSLYLLYG